MGISAGVIALISAASLVASYCTWKMYRKVKKPKGWKALRMQHQGVSQFMQLHRQARAAANESTTSTTSTKTLKEAVARVRVPLNILGALGSPETRTAVRLGTPQQLPGPPGVAEETHPTYQKDDSLLLEVELAKTVNEMSGIEIVDLEYRTPAPAEGDAMEDEYTPGSEEENAESDLGLNWTARWWS